MREQSAAESGRWARAGEKGMVEFPCRGDIVAALPRLEWAAIDGLLGGGGRGGGMHAAAQSYAAPAAEQAWRPAARAERGL